MFDFIDVTLYPLFPLTKQPANFITSVFPVASATFVLS